MGTLSHIEAAAMPEHYIWRKVASEQRSLNSNEPKVINYQVSGGWIKVID